MADQTPLSLSGKGQVAGRDVLALRAPLGLESLVQGAAVDIGPFIGGNGTMTRLILCTSAALAACSTPVHQLRESPPAAGPATEAALLQLADGVFAAARARDAEQFASFFSDGPGFAYLINTRVLQSRDSLRNTFAGMLSRQSRFEPTWSSRHVQIISADVGIVTGLFQTVAQRQNGEEWQARGSVTFVAVREPGGWRIVNWHTSE